MSRQDIVNRIISQRAVAVVRMSESDKILRVVEALLKGGLSAIEITMTTPNALKIITQCNKQMGQDLLVGVGSVLDSKTAEQAISAGAKYVVSPVLKKEIITTAHDNGIPAMPGAFTPTEIQEAHECGADIIKVFPADVVGMAFFRAVRAPMPHVRLMPTGGVTLDNAGDWIRAGACAVGVGSALLDKQAIEEENYSILTDKARKLCDNIAGARKRDQGSP